MSQKIQIAIVVVAILAAAIFLHIDRVNLIATNVQCMTQLKIAAPFYDAAHKQPPKDGEEPVVEESPVPEK